MTNYIEGFVGDENPVLIDIEILKLCLEDSIYKALTGTHKKKSWEDAVQDSMVYWEGIHSSPRHVVIEGVIDLES